MKDGAHKTIWTIGHSTHEFVEFVAMLKSFDIQLLVDVRRFPGSRKFPQYQKTNLEKTLPEQGIAYQHHEDLGGRRKVDPDSHNTVWRNTSFRGYADYMETRDFEEALVQLEEEAMKRPTAIMCSEAVWWRCHRSMVSDALKARGWTVWHIMSEHKQQEHPFTQPAHIVDGVLTYQENGQHENPD